ncbi:unnamed protein product [Orchesella dallaii]|uniref:Uncharacterized protein n=1 Tax=Orchesella dallaii TaxID=48710 RepID=A0ABP1RYR4_9HEXA
MGSHPVQDTLKNIKGQIDDLLALFEARDQGKSEEYKTRLQALFQKVVEMNNQFSQMDLDVSEQENENMLGPWPLPVAEGSEPVANWTIKWEWLIEMRPTTKEEDQEASKKRELEKDNSEDKPKENTENPTQAKSGEAALGLGGHKPAKRIRQLKDGEE